MRVRKLSIVLTGPLNPVSVTGFDHKVNVFRDLSLVVWNFSSRIQDRWHWAPLLAVSE